MTSKRLLAAWILVPLLGSYSQQSSTADHDRVHAEMRNVLYHFTDSVSVHIVHLEGELVPIGKPGIPVFDDANSFNLAIHSAEISIPTDALANALNQYAFAAPDAPIKGIRVSTRGEKLKITGRLHSKGDLPFESEGSLAATPEGEIRVHTEKVKAAHLSVKGLMDLLGETVAMLIDTRKVRGVRAEKNDLILTPSELFPPPHIQGRLSSITIRGNEIVQEYGAAAEPSLKMSGNYMAYRGAQLRFGKLTMSDTDLTLIDMNPEDPFDFYLDHYKDQLVAGYTKTTPSFGLRSYFRDYNKLVPAKRSAAIRANIRVSQDRLRQRSRLCGHGRPRRDWLRVAPDAIVRGREWTPAATRFIAEFRRLPCSGDFNRAPQCSQSMVCRSC